MENALQVWKIASRFSKTGTKKSSVLNLFRKYSIVFAGTKTDKIIDKVKEGDLVAISDGLNIVSVAKVISKPTKVTSFDIEEDDKKQFDYQNWVIAFRVEIFNLNIDEVFTTKMGTFHGMGKYSDLIRKLYISKSSSTTSFKINTYTYSLFDTSCSSVSLIQKELKYIIPVYQRPYSWNESQIETFLNDVFISYWGVDKKSMVESMFIGTMQLSDKKYSDETHYYQEIIDGQQRITTLTLLLKMLSIKYPTHKILKTFYFDWLDTDVNRGQQSKDLKEVIDGKFDNDLNKYAINYKFLKKYFELNLLVEEDEETIEFQEDNFINHLLTNLYFVIIETKAGLSKTLQIFNAINTTGLDLNNTDIFKIRLYEYLSKDADNKKIFESIDKLYEQIDINNNALNRKVIDMNGILGIYKSFLISKYGLNFALWRMATGTFFERLFDTLLNIKQWEGFSTIKDKKDLLKIIDITKIIDIRYEWENKHYGKNGEFDDFNTMLSLRLFWWSRYSGYWNLGFLYLMTDGAEDKKYNQLMQELSRLYISYTLIYQKQINEIHRFTANIFQELVQNAANIDTIIVKVNDKYTSIEEKVNKVISGNIFGNPKIKNILTRMSASIDEYKNGKSIKNIESLIFIDNKIDIEHIQSTNDKDESKRELIKKEWDEVLNSIGNLMVLEYSINRSIGNEPFTKKTTSYKKSSFAIVQGLSIKASWELSSAKIRKKEEICKIKDFIYINVNNTQT